jgi:hypothetical protein
MPITHLTAKMTAKLVDLSGWGRTIVDSRCLRPNSERT